MMWKRTVQRLLRLMTMEELRGLQGKAYCSEAGKPIFTIDSRLSAAPGSHFFVLRGLCRLLWNCRSTITLTIQLTAIPMCPAQGCQAVCVTSNVGDKFHAPHNLLCGRQFVNSVRGRSYSACTKLRCSGFSLSKRSYSSWFSAPTF